MTTPSPDISVVLPVGGVDEQLFEQLESISNSNFDRPYEIVLSINSPGTTFEHERAALADNATLVVTDSSDIRSAAHARNVGARVARSALLAFCDADDAVEPTWLTAMYNALQTHDAVGGYLEEHNLSESDPHKWRPPATPDALPTFLGYSYPVSANMGITRTAFEKIDGFTVGYTRCEDVAFGWALIDADIELCFVPEAIVHYRHREGLLTMIKQHHYYGVGMAEVIERQGIPHQSDNNTTASLAFKANKQPVKQRSVVHVARRGAIATGRLRGLIQEKRAARSHL